MRYDPAIHHRRSIRLPGYDYAQAGAYFVTICSQDRQKLFGEVVCGEMRPNAAGLMVERWWQELSSKFPDLTTDAVIVMPNHLHGVLLVGADLRVRPARDLHTATDRAGVSQIVQWIKTMTTNEYIRGVKVLSWTPFNGRLWQRNYYERIIRSGAELERVREYIVDNPSAWLGPEDEEIPGFLTV